MSDFLTRQIKSYLETHPDETAVAIERRASVPGSTITKIMQGSRPRVDRLGQLLTGVDVETAAEWLRAYLLDDVPASHQSLVRVHVDAANDSGATLRETSPVVQHDRLTLAWHRLKNAAAGDDGLAEWFIDSIDLILGYKDNLETAIEHIENTQPAKYTDFGSGSHGDHDPVTHDARPMRKAAQEHHES